MKEIRLTLNTSPRVALAPAAVAALSKKGFTVQIEDGAGALANYPNAAFAEAGADVLYAPLLPDEGALRELVSLGKPVNGLAAGPWLEWSLHQWAEAGVARVSLGSTLARVLHKTLVNSLTPMLEDGTVPGSRDCAGGAKIDRMLTA